jgi:hypothetical protein
MLPNYFGSLVQAELHIFCCDTFNQSIGVYGTFTQKNRFGTKLHYACHIMADEQNRASAIRHVLHLTEALLLELGVPDGQHFVNDEDLRVQVGGDGER